MALRYALLGILSSESMTGYDLLEYFDRSAGLVWPASQAMIYPELRRMEADGLVVAKVVPRGTRGRKRIYSVTKSGLAELKRWVSESTEHPPDRDPIRLKASYMDVAPRSAARALFAAQIEYYGERIKQWSEQLRQIEMRAHPLIERRLARREKHEHEMILAYKIHVAKGQIARAEMEVKWARRGLAIVAKLEQSRSGANDLAPKIRSRKAR